MGAFFIENYRNCYPTTYSSGGYDLERIASIDETKSWDFKFGSHSIPIFSRTRAYNTKAALKFRGRGYSWETWLVQKHSNNFTEGWWVESFDGNIKDSFTEKIGQVYYIDLYNEIIAYKITTTKIDLNSSAPQLAQNAPKGTNIVAEPKYWHFIKFPQSEITKNVRVDEYINYKGTITSVSTKIEPEVRYKENMVIDFSSGFLPDMSHLEPELGSYYQWIPYYNPETLQPVEEPDGYDFFRPSWLPVNKIDKVSAEVFRWLYADTFPVNFTYDATIPLGYLEEMFFNNIPRGSWAVDKDGNQFISQMTINGTVYNYLTGGDLNELNPATAYFPITPA